MLSDIVPLPGFYEPFSALTHLGGALVFAYLSAPLLRRASGDRRRIAALAVFSFASVFLLSMSGVFHMLREGSAARSVLGRLDHAGIFVLIAGTHTPVQALFFRGLARWGGLAAMWSVAVTGITLFSVFYHSLPAGLGVGIYLTMGWIAGGAGIVVWRRRGTEDLRLLVLGGVVYSAGALLLGLDRPTLLPGVVGPHEVWHVAVLTALCMHWRFFFNHADAPMDDEPVDGGARP